MKIAVIGATGFVGQNLVEELTRRGHEVVAIARNLTSLTGKENIIPKAIDVNDIPALADGIKGVAVVVSAYNAGWTNPNLYDDFISGAKNIEQAVKDAGVTRLIVIGGAGSLQIDGKQLVDDPGFPADYKAGAMAARDYLHFLKADKDLDWSFFSPAIEMHPGITTGRTGQYRLGKTSPVFNEAGHSILSVQDLAVVIGDEVENNQHSKQHFTAAY
ncbi:MAG: NAD(P)H-binding protein [Bacteroidota bacterium]